MKTPGRDRRVDHADHVRSRLSHQVQLQPRIPAGDGQEPQRLPRRAEGRAAREADLTSAISCCTHRQNRHDLLADADRRHVVLVEIILGDDQWAIVDQRVAFHRQCRGRGRSLPSFRRASASPCRPWRTLPRRAFTPRLTAFIESPLFDTVWADPTLSARDRSLITVAALVAMHRPNELTAHLRRAVDNGLSKAELSAAITHLAFYAGFPAAIDASTIAAETLGPVSAP